MSNVQWVMKKRSRFSDPEAKTEAQRYSNPIASRTAILSLLRKTGEPMKIKRIAKKIGLTEKYQIEALAKRLRAMCRDGQIMVDRQGSFGLIDKFHLLHCKVQGHSDGYGFAIPNSENDDVYLNSEQMRLVFDQDEVLVKVTNIDRRGRQEGQVVEVLKRAHKSLVGRYYQENGVGFVLPDNPRISNEILVSPSKRKDAETGQIVQVEVTDYPTKRLSARGKIIEVLGGHLDPGLEIEVAIRSHDIPSFWHDHVLAEASSFERPNLAEIEGRLDLRGLAFVTIDGEDARDYDDAVYCEEKANGWRLWVAIADVSHYVRPSTALDEEAINRGNSVYFPDRVVPMLPEVLSNGLCSLLPLEDRLVLVCEIHINKQGESNYFAFHEGVIKSKARLSYGQVYSLLEGNDDLEDNSDVNSNLLRLFDLYKTLADARSRRGAIDFDTVETRIIFDDFRKIEKIVPIQRNYAHRLIEECMLCANLAAATFLEANLVPTLYRVHEGPTAEKLVNLRLFLSELGLDLKGGEKPSPIHYQRILAEIEERQDSSIIQLMLLRSLKQAVYQPDNKGHFGLNYTTYSHFTSPIRRYPDLLVHRAIRSVIVNKKQEETNNSISSENKKNYAEKLYPYELEKIIAFGEQFSMTERRADDATREVQQWLKCEYLSNCLGMKYSGTVSGVANFGLFIELKDIQIDGLLHVTSLPRDYYTFDASRQRLTGERTGVHYSIGDQFEVLVAMVNLEDKKIDLELASKSKELRKRNNKKGKHKKTNNSGLKQRKNAVAPAN